MPATPRLGPFDLVSPLGKGAMGEVWRARHRSHGTPVAIKFLHARYTTDEWALESFAGEVRAAAGLTHPHIVTVLDHGRVPADAILPASEGPDPALMIGAPFLIMELVEGRPLQHRAGRLTWPQLRETLRCLLDALGHSHARGVIHRDLKPGNVLLAARSPSGRRTASGAPWLMLTDFGLAHALDRQGTTESVVAGTPAYMAPEQLRGDLRDQGPWTDLYSVGCLAWALAAGQPPFGGRLSFSEAIRCHLREAPPEFKSVQPMPDGLERWLRRMLAKDPFDRYLRVADARWGLMHMVEMAAALPAPSARPRKKSEPRARTPVPAPVVPPPPQLPPLPDIPPPPELPPLPTRLPPRPEPVEIPRVAPLPAIRPPLPDDWRVSEGPGRALQLGGVGLNLYGLRAIPFVGRETARTALWEALQTVDLSGRVQVAVLQGASGCGKSRLAEWLCERAHETGAAHILRALHSVGGGPGDGLPGMLVRHLRCAGMRRSALQARVGAGLGRLGLAEDAGPLIDVMSGALDPTSTEAEGAARLEAGERHALIGRLLRGIAAGPQCRRPALVWLDNVHRGPDALAFTRHMLATGQTHRAPVLLVLTVQNELVAERPREREMLEAIAADPATRVLDVGPLPQDEHAELVRLLLGMEGELVARVARRTAGNPLFAVQLVGDWVSRGLLEAGESGFRLRENARVEIPEDLHQAWRDRVEELVSGLAASEARALEIAAALGMDIDPGEWQDACALAHVGPSAALIDTLQRRRLIHRHVDGRGWAFVHPMLRETLLRRSRQARRHQRIHVACAQMLDKRDEEGRGRHERMGRHLLLAGRPLAAVEHILRAAHERMEGGDFSTAERLLDVRDRTLRRLRLPTEDAVWGRGWAARCRLGQLCERLDDAERWGRRALDGAARHGWRDVEARCLGLLAPILVDQSRTDEGWVLLERLLVLGREMEAGRLLGAAEFGMGQVCLLRGQIDDAEGHLGRAGAAFARVPDPAREAGCHLLRARVSLQRGDPEWADRWLLSADRRAREAGYPLGLARVAEGRGEVCAHRGDLDAAARHFQEAARRFDELQPSGGLASRVRLLLARLRAVAESGGPSAGEALSEEIPTRLEAALARLRDLGDRPMLARVHVGLMLCAALQQRWQAMDSHQLSAGQLLVESGLVDIENARLAELGAAAAERAGRSVEAATARKLARQQGLTLPDAEAPGQSGSPLAAGGELRDGAERAAQDGREDPPSD